MPRRLTPRAEVRINAYEVIARAVERGVDLGLMRSYKHTDKPAEDLIRTEIEHAVMNAIAEVVNFGDDE